MNRAFPLLFAVICLFLADTQAKGQDYPMLHYTVEEGLPSNVVYCVYWDSKGYIWICSDKGVARCNGLKFETFSTFNGLPDNEIFFVQEDYYGRIWLGTFNGELCFYENGIFHTAANTPCLKLSFKEPHIRHVSNEADSSVIICYNDPKKVAVIKNGRQKAFDFSQMKDKNIVASICFVRKISENKYSLICNDRIVFVDSLYNVLGMERIDTRLINNGLFTSCQDQDYLFNDSCFFTMDMRHVTTVKNKFLQHLFLHELYVDGPNVFYATTKGLYMNDSLHVIKGQNVSGITQDGQGNYWVSTLGSGVFVLKKNYLNSKYYKGVCERVARDIQIRGEHLFLATTDNKLYDIKGNKANRLFSYEDYKGRNPDFSVDFSFLINHDYKYFNICDSHLVVIDDLLHSPKKVVIKKFQNGVKELLLSGDQVYFRLPVYMMKGSVKDIFYDDAKLHCINNCLDRDRIFCMAKALDNSVWYSTVKGVFKIDNAGYSGSRQLQFRGITYKSFVFFGSYLVGYTHSNRLLICSNVNSAKIEVDSIASGNCIWDKFYPIDPCHMLISTNNQYRLLTINEEGGAGRFSVSVVEDPFLPLRAEAICTDSNSCFFFKNGSLTVIAHKDILQRPRPPAIFFTLLKTGDKAYPVSGTIELPFKESAAISVSFSSLSFGSRDIICQYSIAKDGTDSWRDVKGNEINLLNPGPGDYVIKLRAKTLSSAYCTPVVFTLHILSPFWYSWWFITLTCLSLGAIIGFTVRYRLLHLLQKKEKEHETEVKFMKSEYKALNALMNPHFIFNTLNNVQGLVNRNDKLAANEYIRIFADLIRQNMHNVSKEMISLQQEIDLVNNYLLLEKLRFKDHLNYSINVEEALDLSEIMVPPLLIQPLVENSIKHGILQLESGKGQVIINIYERNDILSIEVRDNGVGIQAATEGKNALHQSYGLDNIRKRIAQLSVILKKEILLDISEQKESDSTRWTIVKIRMPLTPGS